MRLRDVLDLPELRLAVLCGTDEDLDRSVQRAYTTDLLDPSRYLSGGELVLTGLVWRRGPGDSESFASNLAKIGVAGVCAGEAALGQVPADLVEACRRHRLPLLRVPVEVSFQAITDQVSQSIMSQRASGLAALLGRQRGLVAAMARGARLADLLPSIARELCVSCWVCSATGRVLAGTGSLPQPIADRLISAFLHAERLPTTVTLDRREFLLLQVAGRPEHRLAAWCLVCEGPHAAEPPPAEAADELLGLVTMERARIDQVRGADRRGAAELIRVLVNPSDQSDLRAALRACRLSPDATHVVAMASVIAADSGPTAKLATYLLEDLVRPLSAHTAVGRVGDTAMAVLTPKPEAVAGMVEALRGSASSLAPALHGHRLVIGLSGIARGAHALTGAAEQARHTHDAAVCLTEPVSVVSSVDLASHVLLLASVGPEMRQSFRSLLLGPLIDYDRAHHANLVGTLDAFLRSSGSWQRCADEMHVHVNTLRYRLERVEQLTGRDLSRFEDRVDFFLALRLPA